jgi:histidyl-tRNA synthetase
MADVPPSVKGMNDILAPEVSKWHFVEEKARAILESFAYRELRTPVLEYTPLFIRSVGEVTDVVEKQMYTFDDRDGRSVTLRPEGTAPAVRAYIERAQWNKEPVTRWY